MDNEIAFYINGNSVDATEGEKGACGEGNNTLRVIFGADSDSNAVKCDTDPECASLESTPVCDETRHVCVECTQEKGCEGEEYCENNVCKTCASGVWNGEKCVECKDNGNCENPKPICNEENKCVGCKNSDECRLKNPSEENCVTGGACCKDPRMTWKNNECACPEDEPWNGKSCGCLTNNDCESDEFCLTSECNTYECTNSSEEVDQNPYYVGTITEEKACADKPHKCVKKSEYTAQNNDSNSPYVLSSQGMNWWSAKRFCEQHHKNMLKISDLDCCNNFSGTDHGYCYAKEDICSDANGLSHVIKALRKAETGDETQGNNAYWLEDPWGINPGSDSCAVYMIKLDMGYVSNNSRGNAHIDGGQRYVLCK